MFKSKIAIFWLLGLSTAQAFSHCNSQGIAGPGVAVAEEGANPVEWGKYTYAGFAKGSRVGIVTSSDFGKTLSDPVTISNSTYASGKLRLAASENNLYAIWAQHADGGFALMFAGSTNHGYAGSWSSPTNLGLFKISLMQIAADGANVHIAYLRTDGTVAALNSSDGGQHFSQPVNIAPGWGEVVLSSLGKNVFLSWNTLLDGRFDVSVAVSHDSGKTFKVTPMSGNRPSSAREPIFALEPKSGRLSLIWREDTPMQGIYLQSTDSGDTWSQPLAVDAPARQFMVEDDGRYIYVSYLKKFIVDGVDDYQVFVALSNDGGHTFPHPQNLSGPTGISTFKDDEDRPMPWISSTTGAYRLTGVEQDGVHFWDGKDGHFLKSVYLGPGNMAAPAFNSVVWQAPEGIESFGVCQ